MDEPNVSEMVKFGRIEYDKLKILGTGSGGSVVYQGKYEGRVSVAVKRILKQHAVVIKREIDILLTPEINMNIIRYYWREEDDDFAYIATEYGDFSLQTYIEGKPIPGRRRREEPLYKVLKPPLKLNDKEILQQCIEGLLFIHNQGFVHRNIKPSNYIVVRNRDRDLIKLSDFGFSKETHGDTFTISGNHGSDGWLPKEILENKEAPHDSEIKNRASAAVDTFALGLIFFYVLTKGKHPFGTPLLRCANIYEGRYDLSRLEDKFAIDLIENMIHVTPERRPKLKDVKSHSYFLPDVYYISTAVCPGLCVIINQRIFLQSQSRALHGSNRYGTDEDRDSLSETFRMFGFEVKIHENLKSYELLNTMEAIASKDLSRYQSLVVCLLSHGNSGVLYGTDNVPVRIDELMRCFLCSVCPGLSGKPKVFIIQACQGNESQMSRKISASQPPVESSDAADASSHNWHSEDDLDIPEVSDFLKAYATVDGFVSLRDVMRGTIFISSLCETLRVEGHRIPLFDLLQRVNSKVAEWQNANGFKQMPEIRTCLRKHFLLKRQESGFIEGVLGHLERCMLTRIIEKAAVASLDSSFLMDTD